VRDKGLLPDRSPKGFRIVPAVRDRSVVLHIHFPGDFILKHLVQGIKLPSWTTISGEGQGITVLKLHEDTPAYECSPKGFRIVPAVRDRSVVLHIHFPGDFILKHFVFFPQENFWFKG
jgi:hypothetical protein